MGGGEYWWKSESNNRPEEVKNKEIDKKIMKYKLTTNEICFIL